LAPLAVISIAVSVTLATGLEMSSRSAQRQLDTTAAAITGAAQIEVSSGEVGMPEELVDRVRSVAGVRAASPLVSSKIRVVGHDFAMNLIGVDFVAEEQVRSTAIETNGLQVRDPLRLLATPNAVIVTQSLLDRLGLSNEQGAPQLHVKVGTTNTMLIVQGVLRPTGIAAAYSGQVALMDIYAAQELAGRRGLVDRIDVVPDPTHTTAEIVSALQDELAGLATVRPSSGYDRAAVDLLEMVRKSALMFAAAAALVASLLTYATASQWVERQRRQLATLRAVGLEARRVQRMVFIEVGALALIGTGLGIIGGVLISPPLLANVSLFLQVVQVEELIGVSFQSSTLGVAIAVGLMAGLAGCVLPALRAGRRFTLDSVAIDGPARAGTKGVWVGTGLLVAFALAATVGRDLFRGAAMALLVALFVLGASTILALSPSVLRSLSVLLAPMTRAYPTHGHLITRFYRARPLTFSVALTAISTLVGVLVTVFLLIATIGAAFDRFVESMHPDGAVRVLATPIGSPRTADVLSRETIDLIRTTPGIAEVNEQYRALPSVLYRGHTIPVAALSMSVVATRGFIPTVDATSAELARSLRGDFLAVSTGFHRTFGVGTGDFVELDTRVGGVRFEVKGVFEDFGGTAGSILLDLATYDKFWTRAGATSAMIWFDAPVESTLAAVRRRVGDRQDLFFVNGQEAAVATRRYAEVFTSTLHILGAFISSLGVLGVMVLLAGLVAERRRDLGLLRAAGAEPRQLVVLVLLDAIVLGLLGSTIGLALGLACAAPAVDILREYWGWILEQRWTAREIPFVLVGAFAAAVGGAILPARMAFRVGPQDVFGPE